jgi:hypothetical protein
MTDPWSLTPEREWPLFPISLSETFYPSQKAVFATTGSPRYGAISRRVPIGHEPNADSRVDERMNRVEQFDPFSIYLLSPCYLFLQL